MANPSEMWLRVSGSLEPITIAAPPNHDSPDSPPFVLVVINWLVDQSYEKQDMASTTTLPDSELEKAGSSSFSLPHGSQNFSVSFSAEDRRNPVYFSKGRKWIITLVISFFTILVSSVTSFSMGGPSMMRDLHCTHFQATLGLSLYCLGFGVSSLLAPSFSEEFGRLPLYYISAAMFLLMHLMIGLSQNIQTVVLSRFIQGAFGSSGTTMVAGTIADIWLPHERGLPMSLYTLSVFSGNGIGALIGGWVEHNRKLEWRWIQWISLIIGCAYFIVLILVVDETRPSVVLEKLASRMRKATGDARYHTILAKPLPSVHEMVYVSCTRPISLLFHEPIVFAVSAWIGFAWGVYYCMIQSIPGIFKTLHGFNQGQIGSVYMTLALGSLLGFFTNMFQERLYQKNLSARGPQARLYLACFAGFVFPLSMFIFAWSSIPQVPCAILIVALTVYAWAVFTIYLVVFSYLADCYGTYASSALAGQSLFRNLMATTFPLFADKMFHAMGYRWANTMFACTALVMSPIPIILFYLGPKILARSSAFRRLQDLEEKEKGSLPSPFSSQENLEHRLVLVPGIDSQGGLEKASSTKVSSTL
ncbi:hypothetical protein GALMADRAFT_1073826 [Galerina marginata CBS 339.88]|uniref:Major facilitator superfamily (MFS) profile domain-containing protein n=1 Tax=Galerina marginata (strain CBS 339.88) TaxID=685588 RepID=A0A067SIY9_GALM3|nr:hypothetical protein GALMADRAFT_1073826 [Galerina marginata CBS 339.88]